MRSDRTVRSMELTEQRRHDHVDQNQDCPRNGPHPRHRLCGPGERSDRRERRISGPDLATDWAGAARLSEPSEPHEQCRECLWLRRSAEACPSGFAQVNPGPLGEPQVNPRGTSPGSSRLRDWAGPPWVPSGSGWKQKHPDRSMSVQDRGRSRTRICHHDLLPEYDLNGSTDSEEAYMKFALHLALLFLAFTFPARAHDIEYDTGAICDTQNQAQRLATLLDDNEQAIAMINAEEGNPRGCAVETVAVVRA